MRAPFLTPPTESDIVELAAHIRPDDAFEVRNLTGQEPLAHIRHAVSRSDIAYSVRQREGSPLWCVLGAAKANPDISPDFATLWELSTSAVESTPLAFLSICRPALEAVMRAVPEARVFGNVIPARHTRTARWLRWLGADFGKEIQVGKVACVPFFFIKQKGGA